MRSRVIASLDDLALSLGLIARGTEWYLFGSTNRDEYAASDIDLMILCRTALQADTLRQAIDPDSLFLPLDLSLFTFEEAATIDATSLQKAALVFRLC